MLFLMPYQQSQSIDGKYVNNLQSMEIKNESINQSTNLLLYGSSKPGIQSDK